MFKRFLLMVLAFVVISSVCIGETTVLIIDDGGYMDRDGNIIIADPEGKGKYNTSPMVWHLEDKGYTVDLRGFAQTYRSASKNEWGALGDYGLYNGTDDLSASDWYDGTDWRRDAALDACVVIHSRFMSSGVYNRGTDILEWNQLTTPLLSQNGHMIRTGKLGWSDGPNVSASPTETDIMWAPGFVVPSTIFDLSCLATASDPIGSFSNYGSHYVQSPDGNWDPATKIIAEYDGLPFILKIPAGTDFDALNGVPPGFPTYGVAGGPRAYIGHWGYDGNAWPGTTPWRYGWDSCLACCGMYKALFNYTLACVIPEPATIALLGLGGLTLLRRRRRS